MSRCEFTSAELDAAAKKIGLISAKVARAGHAGVSLTLKKDTGEMRIHYVPFEDLSAVSLDDFCKRWINPIFAASNDNARQT